MSDNNCSYGAYVELADRKSVLDGRFSTATLRRIADDMDALAKVTPYELELKVDTDKCSQCKKEILITEDDFTDADGNHYCLSCGIKPRITRTSKRK